MYGGTTFKYKLLSHQLCGAKPQLKHIQTSKRTRVHARGIWHLADGDKLERDVAEFCEFKQQFSFFQLQHFYFYLYFKSASQIPINYHN